jgi:hypothetical protein
MARRYTVSSEADPSVILNPLPAMLMVNFSGGNIFAGMAVRLESGPYYMNRARADNFNSASYVGIALQDVADGGFSGLVQLIGGPVLIPAAYQVGTWTVENKIYLDQTTAGYLRNSPPTGVGNIIVPVGRVTRMSGFDAYIVLEKGEISEIV